jgi:glutamyl-tRNA synthetase/nondiscriminating glutamyl-tRNA synthetase
LIGWSPGGGDELLPPQELARRFSLDAVGHSAGVFDEEKLAWVNRHYLKLADPMRIAELAVPYFQREGVVSTPSDAAMTFLASAMPMATGSVDRLEQIPPRLWFLFHFSVDEAVENAAVRHVIADPNAREVIRVFAEEIRSGPRLDRQAFRAAAERVGRRTGQKGRALFHPIRIALTAEAEGPELDLAVPAIDRGAELPTDSGVARIIGCRERATVFASVMAKLEPGISSAGRE